MNKIAQPLLTLPSMYIHAYAKADDRWRGFMQDMFDFWSVGLIKFSCF